VEESRARLSTTGQVRAMQVSIESSQGEKSNARQGRAEQPRAG